MSDPARPQTLASQAAASAINEVSVSVDAVSDRVGSLDDLATTDKTNVVAAISEVAALAGLGLLAVPGQNNLIDAVNATWTEAETARTQAGEALGVVDDQTDLSTDATPTFANVRRASRLVSTTGPVTAADFFIKLNTSGGAVTLNLASAASMAGLEIVVRRVQGANSYTLNPNGAETINGSADITHNDVLPHRYYSDGTEWHPA